jgi:hypothetical protein
MERIGVWNDEVSRMVRKVLLELLSLVYTNPYAYHELGVRLVEVAAKIAQIEVGGSVGQERTVEGGGG